MDQRRLELKIGSTVIASNGKCGHKHVICKGQNVGHVQLLFLDPTGKITGFVLRTGGQIHHDFIVPLDWIQEVDQEVVHLSVEQQALDQLDEYVSDVALVRKIDQEICENNTFQEAQFSDISATVQDSIVTLRGHVPTISVKLQVENAVKSVAGVLGVENRLVSDYELTIQVAQALGGDERTRRAMISVDTRKGFVSLSGHVGSSAARWAAEEIAASVPSVRGLINCIQAPCIFVDPGEDRFLQPPIGQEVYAADILLGMVDKVIINPHHRRVTAFVVSGNFPDPEMKESSQSSNEDSFRERLVVLPARLIRYVTNTTVFLDINGMEAAEYSDYNEAQYCPPPAEWQPPYPYSNQDILFEGLTEGLLDDLHELVERVINVEQKAFAAEQDSKDKVEALIQESRVEAIARREIFNAKVTQRQVDETGAHVASAIGLTMRAIDEVEIAMLKAIETMDSAESTLAGRGWPHEPLRRGWLI